MPEQYTTCAVSQHVMLQEGCMQIVRHHSDLPLLCEKRVCIVVCATEFLSRDVTHHFLSCNNPSLVLLFFSSCPFFLHTHNAAASRALRYHIIYLRNSFHNQRTHSISTGNTEEYHGGQRILCSGSQGTAKTG